MCDQLTLLCMDATSSICMYTTSHTFGDCLYCTICAVNPGISKPSREGYCRSLLHLPPLRLRMICNGEDETFEGIKLLQRKRVTVHPFLQGQGPTVGAARLPLQSLYLRNCQHSKSSSMMHYCSRSTLSQVYQGSWRTLKHICTTAAGWKEAR